MHAWGQHQAVGTALLQRVRPCATLAEHGWKVEQNFMRGGWRRREQGALLFQLAGRVEIGEARLEPAIELGQIELAAAVER